MDANGGAGKGDSFVTSTQCDINMDCDGNDTSWSCSFSLHSPTTNELNWALAIHVLHCILSHCHSQSSCPLPASHTQLRLLRVERHHLGHYEMCNGATPEQRHPLHLPNLGNVCRPTGAAKTTGKQHLQRRGAVQRGNSSAIGLHSPQGVA